MSLTNDITNRLAETAKSSTPEDALMARVRTLIDAHRSDLDAMAAAIAHEAMHSPVTHRDCAFVPSGDRGTAVASAASDCLTCSLCGSGEVVEMDCAVRHNPCEVEYDASYEGAGHPYGMSVAQGDAVFDTVTWLCEACGAWLDLDDKIDSEAIAWS